MTIELSSRNSLQIDCRQNTFLLYKSFVGFNIGYLKNLNKIYSEEERDSFLRYGKGSSQRLTQMGKI